MAPGSDIDAGWLFLLLDDENVNVVVVVDAFANAALRNAAAARDEWPIKRGRPNTGARPDDIVDDNIGDGDTATFILLIELAAGVVVDADVDEVDIDVGDGVVVVVVVGVGADDCDALLSMGCSSFIHESIIFW
jgi:hypothetical protein